MTIAALVTCYNRVSTTLGFLDKLYAQQMPEDFKVDVWLVDDASPDGTGEKVKQAFPSVNVIMSPGNLYWCRGMRLAWDRASAHYDYDFYLWLNDDVFLKPDALYNVIRDYEKVKSVVVGTFSSDPTETRISYSGKNLDGTRFVPDGINPRQNDGTINGNLVFVPRDVFKRIGPIHNGYHHACGDDDYSMLMRKHNIPFYSSSHYCGWCDGSPERFFSMKGATLKDRWGLLMSPKGYNLHDTFVYRYRHWGIGRAIVSSCHVIFKAFTTKVGKR